jgi:outer membrane protein OmpA-like peptidoglycan-associated protein
LSDKSIFRQGAKQLGSSDTEQEKSLLRILREMTMSRKFHVAAIAVIAALALPAAGWAAETGCTMNKAGGSPGPYKIEFTVGSTAIDAANAKTLDEVASNAKSRYSKVCLLGRADQQGNRQANEALSIRRAETVKRALEHRGVAPKNITVMARGAALEDKLRIASQSQSDRAVDITLQ